MKPWGRLIFVFLAYALALLHTAVPHQHDARLKGQTIIVQASAEDDWSRGLLQRAFSTDLGCGHLENFKKSADTEIHVAAEVVTLLLSSTGLIVDNLAGSSVAYSDHYVAKLKSRLLLVGSASFRAPPSLS